MGWLVTNRSQTHVVSSAHFIVSMDHPSRDAAESVSNALEAAYQPVARRLETPPAPRIRVNVYRHRWSYVRATGHWTASGNIEGVEMIHLLYRGSATPQLAVHEFVHTVTLKFLLDREATPLDAEAFDRRFASFPVWLWEAVACYEADQKTDPQDFDSMRSGRFPDLAELSKRSAGGKIYAVGYTIVEFIESRWGHQATLRLIQSYGDTQEALGVDASEFVRLWQEFAETKYPPG